MTKTTNPGRGVSSLESLGIRVCFGFRISDFGFAGPVQVRLPIAGEPARWHNPCTQCGQYAGNRDIPVKFAIEIGDTEKHRLEYNFNQLLGSLVIKVNEQPVKKSRRLINEPILEVHAFVVGDQEKSNVRIEKERKPLFGSKNRLYVNNRLVKVFSGI